MSYYNIYQSIALMYDMQIKIKIDKAQFINTVCWVFVPAACLKRSTALVVIFN